MKGTICGRDAESELSHSNSWIVASATLLSRDRDLTKKGKGNSEWLENTVFARCRVLAFDAHDEKYKDEAAEELEEEGATVAIFVRIARCDDIAIFTNTNRAERSGPG